jgi:hypothetical protein
MFSSRLPDRLAPNALARALARRRASGTPMLDLTETNPTRVGIAFADDVLAPLADPRGERYDPAPLGMADARAAVAADYARQGLPVDPDRVVLAASTSDAYGILFKLLCDPGTGVLVPQPSYPLFDFLTRLEGVVSQPYRIECHGRWSIDRGSVEAAVTPATRAVLAVSPNNPTGSMLRRVDLGWLDAFCARRNLALIVDEVFAEYPIAPGPDAARAIGEREALTFVLGGLSKSAGLPQVKLGWTVVCGPAKHVADAIARLDVICDTYLAVSTPAQIAAGRLIESGRGRRARIADRVRANMATARTRAVRYPAVTLFEPEGGWSAVMQVPASQSEEALVLRLVEDAGVIVHPGYYFDFPREAFVVVSPPSSPTRSIGC